MQSRSASPPTARRRSARGCSPTVSQLPQSTRLQNPAEWRSVTHPIMSVCLSLCLHPPSSSFKSAACTYIHSFSPVYSNFFSLSSPLSASPLVLSWLLDLSVLSHSLHSSSPVCHQGWISSLHLPPFFFLYLFHSIPWLSPSLSSFASLASTHAAHLSFLPFGRLRHLYIKPSLSRDHVELTQKYNVTTWERNTDSDAV